MDRGLSRRIFLLGSGVVGSVAIPGCNDVIETDGSSGDDGSTGDTTETTDQGGDGSSAAGVELRDAAIDDDGIETGEATTITATVANGDTSAGEFDVTLAVGGERSDVMTLTLNANEEGTVEFTIEPTRTGTHEVTINGEPVGDLVVRAERPETVRDVAAHYYPWYGAPAHDWRGGQWSLESPSTPVLGDYTSSDEAVIEQHIDWCRTAGISWLNVSWWGPGSHEDDRLRNAILDHHRAAELEWSILYETSGRGLSDMDAGRNRRRLRRDLTYLAETYFQRDVYKHIDGRPVLYVWIGNSLRGDVESAFEEAVDAADVRPYLIADLPEGSTLDAHPITAVADAATTYSPYMPRADIEDVFLDRMESAYRAWYLASEHIDVEVFPTAIPGFDDTEITHDRRDNPPLEPSPERFERAAEVTRRFAEGPVFVTSFNEWYEDTQIEPSEEYGTSYLDRTADILASGDREPPTIEGETLAVEFDRTVPESALNPDVEDGRDLTMSVNELRVRDSRGTTVLEADVGGEEEAVTFLLGAHGKERTSSSTWRWFGGSTTTVLHGRSLPSRGTVEFVGRGAAEMGLTVRIGDARGEATIGPEHGTYTVEFS